MLALWASVKSKVWWVLGVAAVVVGVLVGVYRTGWRAAKGDAAEKSLKQVKDYRNVEQEVDAMHPDDRRAELAEWMRKRS